MILVILLLGLGLRLINLNQSLWLDEATQVLLAQKSPYSIFFDRASDFHPPLSYLLTHLWLGLGTSEPSLRLFSVLAGVLTILVLYLLMRQFFGRAPALISSFLLAISPYHIYYSQEIRMYALAALLATLSSYALLRSHKFGGLGNWLFYLITTSLLIWTHYLGVLLIASQMIYVGIWQRDKLKQFGLSMLGILITYLSWIPQLIQQLQSGVAIDYYLPGWREILSLEWYKAVPLTIFKFSAGRIDFDNHSLYSALILGVLTVVGLCFWRLSQTSWKKGPCLIWSWFLVPLIGSLLISLVIPVNQPFRLLFILPAFYSLIALGILDSMRLKYPLLILMVLISITGLGFYFTQSRFQREDWRGATRFINQNIGQGVVLFVWPEPFPPYTWYQGSSRYIALAELFPVDYAQVDAKIEMNRPDNFYLFEYLTGLSDPGGVTQGWLESHRYQIEKIYNFEGLGFVVQYVQK